MHVCARTRSRSSESASDPAIGACSRVHVPGVTARTESRIGAPRRIGHYLHVELVTWRGRLALPVLRLLHLLESRLQLCSVGALKIYFAGPLFTPYERSFIDECAAALRADGFEVFIPHEHELATGVDVTAAWIFAKDRPGIERADAMLAILDGPSVDDGTACEIGMFHALMQSDPSKKGIVGLLTDIRGSAASRRASTSSSRARSRTSAASSPPSRRRATCSEPGDKQGPGALRRNRHCGAEGSMSPLIDPRR